MAKERQYIDKPHFVTSQNFHGDDEYIEWLREIKSRYQTVRSRVALKANYGALEFDWLLGRDIVQKKAEARWGTGVVNQLSLDLREAYPDVKGFSARNLYYMKGWYEFYMADDNHKEILHQLGAKLQMAENQNPMGVATYEGIKIKDKLPSIEELTKRLDMVEQELREYKEREKHNNDGERI